MGVKRSRKKSKRTVLSWGTWVDQRIDAMRAGQPDLDSNRLQRGKRTPQPRRVNLQNQSSKFRPHCLPRSGRSTRPMARAAVLYLASRWSFRHAGVGCNPNPNPKTFSKGQAAELALFRPKGARRRQRAAAYPTDNLHPPPPYHFDHHHVHLSVAAGSWPGVTWVMLGDVR